MPKLICVLLIFTIKIVISAAFTCEKSNNPVTVLSNEERLKDDLMCNYEKYFLPLKNRSAEMDIKIDLDIYEYYISTSTPDSLHLESIITVFWIDVHLKWSPEAYGGINEIIVNSNDIWKPEIMPQEMEIFSNEPSILESIECKVQSNGNVSCRTTSSHFGYCISETYAWPHVVYECHVQYMLWTHNGEVINTDVDENKTIHINEKNKDWTIVDTQIDAYSMKPETNIFISELHFHFQVEQNTNKLLHLFYINLFTLVSLTLLSFWVYFDDTSRLVLIFISILCHFMELGNYRWHVESVKETIPCILAFYRDSLVLTFVQLVETIGLKKIFESDKPIPYLITLFSNMLNYSIIKQILFIQDNMMLNEMENGMENENNLEYVKKSERNKRRAVLFFVDRTFFIFILIGYAVLIITLTSLYI